MILYEISDPQSHFLFRNEKCMLGILITFYELPTPDFILVFIFFLLRIITWFKLALQNLHIYSSMISDVSVSGVVAL